MSNQNIKRPGYKKTKIGWIPKEWDLKNLDECTYIKGRIGWRGLKQSEYTENGPYLIAGKHINNSKILWEKCDHITIERYQESFEIALKIGDVILTKDGSIGNPAFVDYLPTEATINSTMLLIRPLENLYPKFLYYQFENSNFKKIVREKLSGSSIPHIFQRDIKHFPIAIPTKCAQKIIAKILTTWDRAIAQVQKLIDAKEKLKKGLMQQLLTGRIRFPKFGKGINNDELKIIKGKTPHEEMEKQYKTANYKRTKIDWIPEDWEVVSIEEISDVKGGKRIPKGESLTKKITDHPYIRVSDMYNGGVKLDDIHYVPDSIWPKISQYIISHNDLFISVAGTLGIVGDVPECLEGANLTENADKLTNIKCNKKFLYLVLISQLIQTKIQNERTTNAQPKLALKRIKGLLIPLPPKSEQNNIGIVLTTFEQEIEILKQKEEALQKQKKGLMQKLLTGEVRVKIQGAINESTNHGGKILIND